MKTFERRLIYLLLLLFLCVFISSLIYAGAFPNEKLAPSHKKETGEEMEQMGREIKKRGKAFVPAAAGAYDFQMVMQIGVTGGTGNIGPQLIRGLLRDYNTKSIAALSRGTDSRAKTRLAVEDIRVRLIEGNLLDVEKLRTLVRDSSVVYHLGGWGGAGKMDLVDALAVNSISTAVLASLADEYNRRLVFTSTVHVYQLGAKKEGEIAEKELLIGPAVKEWLAKAVPAFKEYADELIANKPALSPAAFLKEFIGRYPIPAGTDIYALTKLLAEQFVVGSPNGIVLRLTNVYGPGDDSQLAVPKFLREMINAVPDKQVKFIPGRQNSYIYVDDVVNAMKAAAEMKIKRGENQVINVCNPQIVSQENLFKEIKLVTNSPVNIVPLSQEEMTKFGLKVPPPLVYDTVLMEQELGLRAVNLVPLKKGLAAAKKWLIDTPDNLKFKLEEDYYERYLMKSSKVDISSARDEGGVLLAEIISDENEFGFCLLMRKENGILRPSEAVMTGLRPSRVRRESIEYLMRLAEKFRKDIQLSGILETDLCADLSGFFANFVSTYVDRSNDVRKTCADLLSDYRLKGYPGSYDSRSGIVRIGCSERDMDNAAAIRSVKRMLERIVNECDDEGRWLVGLPHLPLAILSSVRASAASRAMTVGAYEKFFMSAAGSDARSDFIGMLEEAAKNASEARDTTWFFRDYSLWGPQLGRYLKALIPYKLSRGDRTIVIKSVGAATGEEGCSFGLVVYDALRSYAEENVCAGIADPAAKRADAEAWIGTWDVRIELYDLNISHLASALSGVFLATFAGLYTAEAADLNSVPLKIRELLTITQVSAYAYEIRVDERVRGWITPVYVDLNKNTAVRIVGATGGDIVSCRQVGLHLDNSGKRRLTDVITRARSPELPVFSFADIFLVSRNPSWVFIPSAVIAEGVRRGDPDIARLLANALWMMVFPQAAIAPALFRDSAIVELLEQIQQGGYVCDAAISALARAYTAVDPHRPQIAPVLAVEKELTELPAPLSVDAAVSSALVCCGDS